LHRSGWLRIGDHHTVGLRLSAVKARFDCSETNYFIAALPPTLQTTLQLLAAYHEAPL
jgi:ferric-dicitrate binding protein FerR (iron transport regulator)